MMLIATTFDIDDRGCGPEFWAIAGSVDHGTHEAVCGPNGGIDTGLPAVPWLSLALFVAHIFTGLLRRAVPKKRLATDRKAFERASPMSRVHADAPPVVVVHGGNDSPVPVQDGRVFAALLRGVDRFLAFVYAAWCASRDQASAARSIR